MKSDASAGKTYALSGGEVLTYTIVVTNTGDADATAVFVTDTPNWTYLASVVSDGTPSPATSGDITWDLGEMYPGEVVTLTYTATMKAAGDIPEGIWPVENWACVESPEAEEVCDNATFDVTADATLTINTTPNT